ncbi:hypothetical protein NQ028_10700 [Corynebacterium phoceense]|uniref:hypothetical protein n=1 Tax=Corynebacterium phoceense TaxID=1686286 RepID=UPI00211BA6C7|nr:hypothetical protein [Corynebacterium phoceense]MCQ9341603.1 hypothetical protein [Corynebacterium phoceense]
MHDGTAFGLPAEQADHIMNPHLEIAEGWTLMGSDGDAAAGRYNGFALTIGGDATDSETARGWFEALAKDGRVVLPMGKQQWGDVYAQVEDKFGIFRSVNIPSK